MARQASNKSDSGSSSTVTNGFEADSFDISPAVADLTFYRAQIPVCPWFLETSEAAGKGGATSELEIALAA